MHRPLQVNKRHQVKVVSYSVYQTLVRTVAHVDVVAAVPPSGVLLTIPLKREFPLHALTITFLVHTLAIFIRIAKVLSFPT